ncbi:hypothetical protein MCERE10_03317 [Burkholderiaceae bacterium]
MNNMLPNVWRPDLAALLPANPSTAGGPALAWWIALLYLCMITVRSLIHMLVYDSGAHSIATIDVSVAGGANIVAMLGQLGAIQLLLALLLWVLLLRYRGFVPLVLLVFMLEPFLRAYVGHLKPVITEGVAPGVALNWAVMPILAVVFFLSLCPAQREPTR